MAEAQPPDNTADPPESDATTGPLSHGPHLAARPDTLGPVPSDGAYVNRRPFPNEVHEPFSGSGPTAVKPQELPTTTSQQIRSGSPGAASSSQLAAGPRQTESPRLPLKGNSGYTSTHAAPPARSGHHTGTRDTRAEEEVEDVRLDERLYAAWLATISNIPSDYPHGDSHVNGSVIPPNTAVASGGRLGDASANRPEPQAAAAAVVPPFEPEVLDCSGSDFGSPFATQSGGSERQAAQGYQGVPDVSTPAEIDEVIYTALGTADQGQATGGEHLARLRRYVATLVALLVLMCGVVSYEVLLPQAKARAYRNQMATNFETFARLDNLASRVLSGNVPADLRGASSEIKDTLDLYNTAVRKIAEGPPPAYPLQIWRGDPSPLQLHSDLSALIQYSEETARQLRLRQSLYEVLARLTIEIDTLASLSDNPSFEGGDTRVILRAMASSLTSTVRTLESSEPPKGCERLHGRLLEWSSLAASTLDQLARSADLTSTSSDRAFRELADAGKSALQTSIEPAQLPSERQFAGLLQELGERYGFPLSA
jgi:hypothetical protein